MNTLADLHRAVHATLTGKRVGQPVFVRYLWHTPNTPAPLLPRLAQLTATVGTWVGQPLDRLSTAGHVDAGQVTLTLEYRDGATALVSWARSPAPGDGIDLLIVGHRGAIYHDFGSTTPWDEPADVAVLAQDAGLIDLIDRAIRSGKPQHAAREAKP